MEELVINFARHAPGLAVAVAIVVIFVRHLNRKDDQIKIISDRCHDTQQDSSKALREMTQAITEVTERLRMMNGKR